MNPTEPQAAPPAPTEAKKRRGIVLVAVLVVVAALALAGYQFADMMTSEFRGSESSHRMVQAKSFADSGVHFAAAALSSPDNFNNILFGNPFNNPGAFRDVAIQGGDGNVLGRFSIIAPPDIDSGGNQTEPVYGAADESSKINPNAIMKLEPTGQLLHDMLMKLPNMTEDIAYSIVAWMGGAVGAQNGGAQNDYYSQQSPSYRLKNGPLDSIDELRLVRGVTYELLYGNDAKRNGVSDNNGAAVDRGWSAYLTVHSREQAPRDANGQPLIFLGNQDLLAVAESLTLAELPDDMVKFIVLYKKYGPASSTGAPQSTGSTIAAMLGLSTADNFILKDGDLATKDVTKLLLGAKPINSIFDLVNAKVSISSGRDPQTGKQIYTVYTSPLNDVGMQRELLPQLFTKVCTTEDVELAARVNVNTAPQAVLMAIPELVDTDVSKITGARQGIDTTSDLFQTPAWLVTEAQVDIAKLRKIEKYITTRTQVYRVQSVGYFEGGKGPAIRVEAVIDTNNGRPRIIAWRDLSELGRGLTVSPNP